MMISQQFRPQICWRGGLEETGFSMARLETKNGFSRGWNKCLGPITYSAKSMKMGCGNTFWLTFLTNRFLRLGGDGCRGVEAWPRKNPSPGCGVIFHKPGRTSAATTNPPRSGRRRRRSAALRVWHMLAAGCGLPAHRVKQLPRPVVGQFEPTRSFFLSIPPISRECQLRTSCLCRYRSSFPNKNLDTKAAGILPLTRAA